jgi:hypothetical protein
MYFAPKEHNPPHIHVYYGDTTASFLLEDGRIIDGYFPAKQTKLVQAWIELRREELLADWQLCQNGEKPFQIEPLR